MTQVEPKAENAYGDTFDKWREKLREELQAEGVSEPTGEFAVAAFNCNYLPEVAAYQVACETNPARRLRHIWDR